MKEQALKALFAIDGKTALVTDSGHNASMDVAQVLADAGATVILADQQRDHLQPVVDQILGNGGKAVGLAANVEREDSVIELFERVRGEWGVPDIVVNCAAMMNNCALTELSGAAWDEVQSVDLRSVFLCMREAIKSMLSGGRGGRIVNISTMGSLHPGLRGNGAYGAARAGLNALVRSAASDYAKDRILINNVLQGAVAGKVRFHPDTQARMKAGAVSGPSMQPERLPLGMGNAGDIAAAVLYLVGPSGGYITGQIVVLDGGFLVS